MSRTAAALAGLLAGLFGVLFGVLLGVLLGVLTVLVGVGWDPLVDLDHIAARQAYDATFGHDGRIAFWDGVTSWGAPQQMRFAMLAGAVLVALARRWSLAGWLVALAVLEGIVAPAAKQLLERPRPVWAEPIATVGSTSFPSGHATAAATAAVAAVLVARALGRGPVTRVVLPALAVLAAVAVAASRVFLGVHYVSDVVGGCLLGAVLALATYDAAAWAAGLRRISPPG